jgi:thiamine pyrophosphokinase
LFEINDNEPASTHAIIFANGRLGNPPEISDADLIIAADGGAINCLELGLVPSAVVGDMDSIDDATQRRLVESGCSLIRHPARKDFTDLELALDYAIEKGASEISIIAALGARWDQTLANLLLPASQKYSKLTIRLVDGEQTIQIVRAGEPTSISGKPGDTVSLIPVAGDAGGITTHGLEYPLQDGSLSLGGTRGNSNVMQADRATISLRKGIMVIVHIGAGMSIDTDE